MARSLRIEFADNAVYHVSAHGNVRKPVVRDEEDRRQLLALLPQTFTRLQGRKRPSRTIWGFPTRRSVGC